MRRRGLGVPLALFPSLFPKWGAAWIVKAVGNASEISAGKRSISKAQAKKKLAERFNLSAEVFI